MATDVQDLGRIDTSDTPDPRLHRVHTVDAIAQGKPQVIVFATPKFSTSPPSTSPKTTSCWWTCTAVPTASRAPACATAGW